MPAEISDTRTFEFSADTFKIIQILENTGTKMEFVWGKVKCPYCNRDFGKKRIHTFNRIEVLIPVKMEGEPKEKLIENLTLLGFSTDNRTIIVNPKLQELLPLIKFGEKNGD